MDGLGSQFFGQFAFDEISDQAARPLHESELIGKAAFEQDPNGKVAREVGRSGQCRKLSDLKVGKLGSFGQNIQVSARSALYFREFPAEVVGKNFLHAAI